MQNHDLNGFSGALPQGAPQTPSDSQFAAASGEFPFELDDFSHLAELFGDTGAPQVSEQLPEETPAEVPAAPAGQQPLEMRELFQRLHEVLEEFPLEKRALLAEVKTAYGMAALALQVFDVKDRGQLHPEMVKKTYTNMVKEIRSLDGFSLLSHPTCNSKKKESTKRTTCKGQESKLSETEKKMREDLRLKAIEAKVDGNVVIASVFTFGRSFDYVMQVLSDLILLATVKKIWAPTGLFAKVVKNRQHVKLPYNLQNQKQLEIVEKAEQEKIKAEQAQKEEVQKGIVEQLVEGTKVVFKNVRYTVMQFVNLGTQKAVRLWCDADEYDTDVFLSDINPANMKLLT